MYFFFIFILERDGHADKQRKQPFNQKSQGCCACSHAVCCGFVIIGCSVCAPKHLIMVFESHKINEMKMNGKRSRYSKGSSVSLKNL